MWSFLQVPIPASVSGRGVAITVACSALGKSALAWGRAQSGEGEEPDPGLWRAEQTCEQRLHFGCGSPQALSVGMGHLRIVLLRYLPAEAWQRDRASTHLVSQPMMAPPSGSFIHVLIQQIITEHCQLSALLWTR